MYIYFNIFIYIIIISVLSPKLQRDVGRMPNLCPPPPPTQVPHRRGVPGGPFASPVSQGYPRGRERGYSQGKAGGKQSCLEPLPDRHSIPGAGVKLPAPKPPHTSHTCGHPGGGPAPLGTPEGDPHPHGHPHPPQRPPRCRHRLSWLHGSRGTQPSPSPRPFGRQCERGTVPLSCVSPPSTEATRRVSSAFCFFITTQ